MNVFTVKRDFDEPEPFRPKYAVEDDDRGEEEDEEDDDSGEEEDEEDDDSGIEEEDGEEEMSSPTVKMVGILSLQPFKILRGTNRVVMGPGDIAPALMEVLLDNGLIIMLDGFLGVIHDNFVLNADPMLQGRDLTLGMTPQILVEGLLHIRPKKLEDIARCCGIVSGGLEIKVVPSLATLVTPHFGPFVEAARYLMISNDDPVHASGLFQARAVWH
jgi:hypothetical protein